MDIAVWFMTGQSDCAKRCSMKQLGLATTIAVLFAGTGAAAAAQGPIGTVERGSYQCELPGDAAGAVGVVQPAESFSITSASRYAAPEGSGTYLRRGNMLTMTSGPRNGQQYEVVSTNFLRKMEDGKPGRLRCVRSGR